MPIPREQMTLPSILTMLILFKFYLSHAYKIHVYKKTYIEDIYKHVGILICNSKAWCSQILPCANPLTNNSNRACSIDKTDIH